MLVARLSTGVKRLTRSSRENRSATGCVEARNPERSRRNASQAGLFDRRSGHERLAAETGGIEARRRRFHSLGGKASACGRAEALLQQQTRPQRGCHCIVKETS